jgi:hypothetical protein
MNWKLILGLSMFGLAMALGTVYFIPAKAEEFLWPAIFLICAVVIARQARQRFFLHGFLVGLTNWFWVASAHLILSDAYLARHAEGVAALQALALPASLSFLAPIVESMRRFALPIPGASGIVIGLLSWIASKILAPKISAAPSRPAPPAA